MTDRELLERAARAAGYIPCGAAFKNRGIRVRTGEASATFFDFNPLDDDGQALRLAVKRNLQIDPGSAERPYAVVRTPGSNWMEFREQHGADAAAATRRAVVRAAAALAPEEP